MIRIERVQTPDQFARLSTGWTEAVEKKLQRNAALPDKNQEKEKPFSPHWSDYKSFLSAGKRDDKCAYCEVRLDTLYGLDVEHVRPKAKITEWESMNMETTFIPKAEFNKQENREVDERPKERAGTSRSPGYWWLAYEWNNYLLACKECNGWKHNYFPVRDHNRRWNAKQDSFDEGVLLLDPAATDFNPRVHFHWEMSGVVLGKTLPARATIITCGLNRKSLRLARERLWRELQEHLETLRALHVERNITAMEVTLQTLRAKTDRSENFTAMARSVVRSFYDEHQLTMVLPWNYEASKTSSTQR